MPGFKLITLVVLLTISIMFAACTNSVPDTSVAPISSSPSPSLGVIDIEILPSGTSPTEENEIIQSIPVNNCGGTGSATNEIARSRTFLRTAELGLGITGNTQGEFGIPNVGNVQIGVEIAQEYGLTYGTEDTNTRGLVVETAASSNIEYDIRLYDLFQTGEVRVTVDGAIIGVYPYKFRVGSGISLVNSRKIDCASTQPAATSTIQTDSTVVASASSPTPIATQVTVPAETNTPSSLATETVQPVVPASTTQAIDFLQSRLSGNWTGKIFQENADGSLGDPEDFQVLMFDNDDALEGIASIGRVGGFEPFVTFIVRGQGDEAKLTLKDIEVIDTNASRGPFYNGYWCQKEATLMYSNEGGVERLTGRWTAPNCRPGRIELQKSTDTSIAVLKLTAVTQDIGGTWRGKIYQENEDGILDEGTPFEITLRQSEDRLEGTATVGITSEPDPYVTFTIRGQMRSRKYEINEYEIIDTNASRGPFGGGWCIKNMNLIIESVEAKQTLRGVWSAPNCRPGRIEVSKVQ